MLKAASYSFIPIEMKNIGTGDREEEKKKFQGFFARMLIRYCLQAQVSMCVFLATDSGNKQASL